MNARKLKPGVNRAVRFVRRWRLDRNPLRRAADRVETVVLAVLVAAFLIGGPFAALAAGALDNPRLKAAGSALRDQGPAWAGHPAVAARSAERKTQERK